MNTDVIEKCLHKDRPKLSDSSVKSYLNCIKVLYKMYLENDKKKRFSEAEVNPNFLKDSKNVLKLINSENKLTTKKQRLSCVVVFTKACFPDNEQLLKTYYEPMMDVAKKYQDWLKEQKKSDTQKENWLEKNELDKIINNLYVKIKEFKSSKYNEKLSREQYTDFQVYVVLRLLDWINIRNEFAEMKIIVVDDKEPSESSKQNFLVDNDGKYKVILNKFKNEKYLGKKEYNVPENLNKILRLWFRFNKSGYVLSTLDGKKELGSNGLSKMLISFFKKVTGKSISTSMIRHIQATADDKDNDTILESERKQKAIEDKYLHSSEMHRQYAKKD
jgi:hypothetical protein